MGEPLTQSEKFERWQARWTPQAVSTREAEKLAKARAEREQQRAAASGPAELTVEALLAKLEFSREYAGHLMQPYCGCGHGWDGWEYCEHARDEGWPRMDWLQLANTP
jgi:hypothetical protein